MQLFYRINMGKKTDFSKINFSFNLTWILYTPTLNSQLCINIIYWLNKFFSIILLSSLKTDIYFAKKMLKNKLFFS